MLVRFAIYAINYTTQGGRYNIAGRSTVFLLFVAKGRIEKLYYYIYKNLLNENTSLHTYDPLFDSVWHS